MAVQQAPGPGTIAAFALRNAKAIQFSALALCVWGVLALYLLPTGIYPDLTFPRIVVIAERGEDSVENVMIGVTRPLEEAVNAVPGLARVRSKTIRGACEMSLDFAPDTDLREALAQTRARIAALLPSLPPGVATTVEPQTPSLFPVLSFNVTLDAEEAARGPLRDGADLLQWARIELKPRLARVPDVFLVTVQGADERVILVEGDPRRMASARLSLGDLAGSIRESNAIGAVGRLERDHEQFQVLVSSELRGLDDIAGLPVATRAGVSVHLRDVAEVRSGLADRTRAVTGDGKDAVVVSLFLRNGGRITALSDRVREAIAEVSAALPAGVRIQRVYDQADLVRESIASVRDAIVLGMALAVAILWIFLGSWRLTLVASIAIPVSVLGTFAVLSALGESLNLMSLGGIAVAIGLIIDDAIVVVENIARGMRDDLDRGQSVIAATGEVVGAVVGSSLTTVVVFVPLVLFEGVVGQFFRAMAVALSLGILVSLLVSLTLTPILCAGRVGPRPGERSTRRWMDALAGAYERVIRRALRYPGLTALGLVAGACLGAWLAREQETGFLPHMDEGGFVLDYFMPVGTSLAETDGNCRSIEAVLLRTPEVLAFSRRTGAELGFFATEQFTGDFLVALKPAHSRARSSAEVVDGLREAFAREVPQIETEFVQVMEDTINDLAGNPAPIEVKVFGSEYRALQEAAATVAGKVEGIPGVVDVKSGVSFGSPEITYRLDLDAISRCGLTGEDVEAQLRMALLGEESSVLRRGEMLVPIVVRYPDRIRRDPTWLPSLPIFDRAGRVIPASLVSRVEERINVNELARENQQPLVSVTMHISQRDLGGVARDVRALLERLPRARGVRFELAGQVELQERAFRNLMVVIAIAIGLVLLLLIAQFRSYRLPAVIFLTLPFSQIGALLALRWTDTELNISACMGLLLLVGLVVKNGIILIDYTAQLRAGGGCTLEDALARAGRVRLRPILMTSLTAIMALFPLALNLGAGAELQRPLAIAVIGGLSVSTLFTLLVIPVAHLLLGEPAHARAAAEEAAA